MMMMSFDFSREKAEKLCLGFSFYTLNDFGMNELGSLSARNTLRARFCSRACVCVCAFACARARARAIPHERGGV
jgi:hypothetical protein